MRVDVHQHIWTEPLLDALATRREFPFVRRDDGLTVLHSASERPYLIDVDAEQPSRRQALLRADGLDLALIAISSPIGVEVLPRGAADQLIDAHLDGVGALGPGFAGWGPIALDDADPDDVDRVLRRGFVGVSLPAPALAGADSIEAIGAVLDRIAERNVPLFIHPGAAVGAAAREASLSEPLWWRALTDYVAQMHAAWLTFMTAGRREHPELVVVFAMLAGGAPLLSERLTARGGPAVDLRDPGVFYDTSSYGPSAVDATARLVGTGQLLYGSDRPVAEPRRCGHEAALRANGSRFLARVGVAA